MKKKRNFVWFSDYWEMTRVNFIEEITEDKYRLFLNWNSFKVTSKNVKLNLIMHPSISFFLPVFSHYWSMSFFSFSFFIFPSSFLFISFFSFFFFFADNVFFLLSFVFLICLFFLLFLLFHSFRLFSNSSFVSFFFLLIILFSSFSVSFLFLFFF